MRQPKTKVTQEEFVKVQSGVCALLIQNLQAAIRQLGLTPLSETYAAVIHRFLLDASVQGAVTVYTGREIFDFTFLEKIDMHGVNEEMAKFGGVMGSGLAEAVAKNSPKLN